MANSEHDHCIDALDRASMTDGCLVKNVRLSTYFTLAALPVPDAMRDQRNDGSPGHALQDR